MKLLRSKWWVLLIVLAFIAITPITAAAITNSEIIAVMNASIAGLVDIMAEAITGLRGIGQDAFCASGATAFCP